MSDIKGGFKGALGTRPPNLGLNYFVFMQFLANILRNNRLTGAPSREIPDPPLNIYAKIKQNTDSKRGPFSVHLLTTNTLHKDSIPSEV